MSNVTCPDCLAGVSHSWSSDETKYVHAMSMAGHAFMAKKQKFEKKYGREFTATDFNVRNMFLTEKGKQLKKERKKLSFKLTTEEEENKNSKPKPRRIKAHEEYIERFDDNPI